MPRHVPKPLEFILALFMCMLVQAVDARTQAAGLQTLQTRFYQLHTDLDEATARNLGMHMDVVFEAYGKMFEGFQGRP